MEAGTKFCGECEKFPIVSCLDTLYPDEKTAWEGCRAFRRWSLTRGGEYIL